MKKIMSLTKVMLKNTNTGLESGKKKKKKWQKYLTYLGFTVLFIVLSVSIYFLSKEILLSLKNEGLETLALQLVMIGLSAYLLLGGIITVPVVFYFSKDVENLLALPLKPFEILSAKTITTYFNLLISTSFIILPFGVAYQLVIQPSLIFGLFYLLAFLILPILPLIISITLVVLLFTFIPKANNKDLFTYISSFLMIGIIILINLNTGNAGSAVEQIILEKTELINMIPKLIPSITLLIQAVSNYDVLALVAAALVSMGLAYAILRLMGGFYFKGVVGAQVSSSKKKKRKQINKSQSQVMAILKTDFINILRTPSLAINYFLPFVIMPLFIFLPLIFGVDASDFEMLKEVLMFVRQVITSLDGLVLVPILIFGSFIITYILSSLSTITSTSISREGETMQVYKSMPVDLMTVVNAKLILGMIVSAIFPSIIAVIIALLLRLNIIAVIIIFVSIFVAVAFSNTSDIIFDMIKPKLEWDDEIQAVKQNFISVIPMLLSFAIIALFVFIFVVFNTLYSSIFILLLSTGLTVFNYKVMIEKYGIKQLDKAIQKL